MNMLKRTFALPSSWQVYRKMSSGIRVPVPSAESADFSFWTVDMSHYWLGPDKASVSHDFRAETIVVHEEGSQFARGALLYCDGAYGAPELVGKPKSQLEPGPAAHEELLKVLGLSMAGHRPFSPNICHSSVGLKAALLVHRSKQWGIAQLRRPDGSGVSTLKVCQQDFVVPLGVPFHEGERITKLRMLRAQEIKQGDGDTRVAVTHTVAFEAPPPFPPPPFHKQEWMPATAGSRDRQLNPDSWSGRALLKGQVGATGTPTLLWVHKEEVVIRPGRIDPPSGIGVSDTATCLVERMGLVLVHDI